MTTIAAVAVTCWLCALIAIPRKPSVANEVAELAYMRLLGRQQRLALLAGVISVAFLLAVMLGLPPRVQTDPGMAPAADTAAGCNDEMLCLSMYGR